jgi:hypothetical protein
MDSNKYPGGFAAAQCPIVNLKDLSGLQRVAHHQSKKQREIDNRSLQHVAGKHLRSRIRERQL